MDNKTKKKLENGGWVVGDVTDLLSFDEEVFNIVFSAIGGNLEENKDKIEENKKEATEITK